MANEWPHALNWFEIPVLDMERAREFYGTILDVQLADMEMSEGYLMAMFPAEGVGGALVQGNGYVPSQEGCVIYLNAAPELATVVERVEPAGGVVEQHHIDIGENGVVAFIYDTEGNRIGLHANQ